MSSRIVELANTVVSGTQTLSEYLTAQKQPFPSFEEDGPVDLHIHLPEVQQARSNAISACYELLDLLQGPKALVRPVFNATSVQAIHRYDIPKKVPLQGEISFGDLASRCGLYEPDLRRIIRFAITYHRLFREQRPGFVSHSAASKWLAESEEARDGVVMIYETMYKSFARTVDAMEHFHGQEANQTGFNLAYNTDQSLFDYIKSRPEEAKMFEGAMKSFTANIPGNSPSFLISGYPWESLGSATVIDVGGSGGHISFALAQAFPQLNFIIQDLPDVVQQASVPAVLQNRVKYEAYNFFEPQKTPGDIYFFRWIFHNWPDEYVVKILQNLVFSLKPGSRVIINDSVCPGPNTVPYEVERVMRGVDMVMMSLHNAREREKHEWESILKTADGRFGLPKFYFPTGASLAIIESVWEG